MDKVNHPKHYNTGNIEVIDAIEDWKLNFNLGNAVKYIARSEHKGNKTEDLKKAIWYIEREISNSEQNSSYLKEIPTCSECLAGSGYCQEHINK